MKKRVFIITVSYILFILVLILLPKDKTKYITLLSILEDQVQVLSHGEDLKMNIYADQKDIYFLTDDFVSKAKLSSDKTDLDINVQFIVNEDTVIPYQGTTFYLVQLNIQFQLESTSDILLEFMNSYLQIQYQDDVLSLPLGDFVLYITDFNYQQDLEWNHLKAINHQEVFDGISIELTNQTNESIEIIEVKSLHPNIVIEDTQNTLIDPCQSKTIIYELKSVNQTHLYRRFPLLITYRIFNQTRTLIMDDFVYYNVRFNDLEDFPYEYEFIRYYY